ncbi:MAG TPA: hypothetical protein VEK08_00400 [Planctomycetota bacterium]|nr:hypothetical protein [Planctomycetota bacterium]
MELFEQQEAPPILECWAVCIRRSNGELELLPGGMFDTKAHAQDYGRRCNGWYRDTTALVVPVTINTATAEVIANMEASTCTAS